MLYQHALHTPLPVILLALAVALPLVSGAGYWGADNRIQGYTDSQGRHYPRPPGALIDYYNSNSADDDVSNQISKHQALPSVPFTRHNRWRHRQNHHDKEGSGRGRGGRRRGGGPRLDTPAASSSAYPPPPPPPTDGPSAAAAPSSSGGAGRQRKWHSGVYRTSQWGSARIPYPGAVVNVPVLEGTHKAYRGSITTSVVPPPPGRGGGIALRAVTPPAAATGAPSLAHRPDSLSREVHDAPAPSFGALPCVRCPGDRAVVASRGRQMVLLEQPELRPCPQGPHFKISDLRMEWTQGPKPGTLVKEGYHVMLGQVLYKEHLIQMCRMKLNVMVRKCPPLMLPKHMAVQCTMGNAWGSRCHFACSHGKHLVGHSSLDCSDTLAWSHPMPACEATRGCPAPMSPPHGNLLCQVQLDNAARAQVLPEHSKCEYVCDSRYEVPATQHHLTTIVCQEGAWNSTVDPTCIYIGGIGVDHPNAIQRDGPHKRRRHKLRSGAHKRNRNHRSHNDPCHPNPCKEGGTCLRGPKAAHAICHCPEHREGDYCEYERCREKCENGGKCVMFGEEAVCYCPPGFHGNHCEEKDSR